MTHSDTIREKFQSKLDELDELYRLHGTGYRSKELPLDTKFLFKVVRASALLRDIIRLHESFDL